MSQATRTRAEQRPSPADPGISRGPALARFGRWLACDYRWLVSSAVLISLLLKLVIALSPTLDRTDSDRAVQYLSALHAQHGDLSTWFWGQEYGGALFQNVLGGMFVLTGNHLWMLPAGLLVLSTTIPVLTWLIGRQLGSPREAAIAAALLAIGPPESLYMGVASDPFYTLGLSLSLVSLWLALTPGRLGYKRASLIGLLVGLAVWTSPFSLLTCLPTLLLLTPRLRRDLAKLIPFSLGAALGGLPDIVTTIQRGHLSPDTFGTSDKVSLRVEQAVADTWRHMWTRFDPTWAPGWLIASLAISGLVLAIGASFVAATRVADRRADVSSAALLLPILLWVPFHVRAHLPFDEPAARYAYPLLPFLALYAARKLVTASAQTCAVGALLVFTAAGTWHAAGGLNLSGHVVHNRNYDALAADLDRHGRTAVFADYWIAYRLAAETDEGIVADPPAMSRYAPYRQEASDAEQTTLVVFADGPNNEKFTKLYANDPTVQRVRVAHFVIFYIDHRISPPAFDPTHNIP